MPDCGRMSLHCPSFVTPKVSPTVDAQQRGKPRRRSDDAGWHCLAMEQSTSRTTDSAAQPRYSRQLPRRARRRHSMAASSNRGISPFAHS